MLVSDDDDTGTGTGTGSRRCGALPQLSAWLAKGLAIPEVGIMQCLERRKAQEKEKGLHPRFSCSIHVECTSCLAKSSVPTSQYCESVITVIDLGCEVTYVHYGLPPTPIYLLYMPPAR